MTIIPTASLVHKLVFHKSSGHPLPVQSTPSVKSLDTHKIEGRKSALSRVSTKIGGIPPLTTVENSTLQNLDVREGILRHQL
jgi:hypothetical protein